MTTKADPWGVFGGDSSDEEDSEGNHTKRGQSILIQEGITFLIQHFVKHNPIIAIDRRIVALNATESADDHSALKTGGCHAWREALLLRGIQILEENCTVCDAAIVTNSDFSKIHHVVPGGCALVVQSFAEKITPQSFFLKHFHPAVWRVPCSDDDHLNVVAEEDGIQVFAIIRWPCPINSISCPWKPKSQTNEELEYVQKATIVPSAYEVMYNQSQLSTHATQQAVQAMREFGYCIVRHILDPEKCKAWGQAILQDLAEAAEILLSRDQVDIYNPQDSRNDPQSYRELSMREDLRMDLRDGPRIRALRVQEEAGRSPCPIPVIDSGSASIPMATDVQRDLSSFDQKSCLRFHPSVLNIVKRTLNPSDATLAAGNYGRFNFDGSGPDGSPQPLRIGPMGGIISLPGSADQAIHADTPHLFETYDCLPAHYVNAFCLGAEVPYERDSYGFSTGATSVGGTAFVHASHKLSFTASLKKNWSVMSEPLVLQNLVRPSLDVGDLLLFDCRILHFGLANMTKDVERPLLYTNMTQAWFHDPKNWNDQQAIFTRL